jgi:hypothetical protein
LTFYRLPLVAILLLLSGCTFHSNQLEAARSVLNPAEVLPENYWLLQLGDSKIPLIRVSGDDPAFSSFTNSEGVVINLNATDITYVGRWPEGDTDIRISRAENVVTHQIAGENGGTIEVRCTEWTMVDVSTWHSECQSISGPSWSYRNEIETGETGQATRLSYAIWPGLSPIDLIWFPVSGESTSILPYISQ